MVSLSFIPVLHVALVWFLLLLSSIPLYTHMGVCLPILLLEGIWLFLVWGYREYHYCEHSLVWWTQCSFLFSISPGAELLGHGTSMCIALVDSTSFPLAASFTPCQRCRREPTSSSTLSIVNPWRLPQTCLLNGFC